MDATMLAVFGTGLTAIATGVTLFVALWRVQGNRFDTLERHLDKRFEAVDKRFEAVDKRFEAVDRQFEAVDKRWTERFEMAEKASRERFEMAEKASRERFDMAEKASRERFEAMDAKRTEPFETLREAEPGDARGRLRPERPLRRPLPPPARARPSPTAVRHCPRRPVSAARTEDDFRRANLVLVHLVLRGAARASGIEIVQGRSYTSASSIVASHRISSRTRG